MKKSKPSGTFFRKIDTPNFDYRLPEKQGDVYKAKVSASEQNRLRQSLKKTAKLLPNKPCAFNASPKPAESLHTPILQRCSISE